VVLRLVALLLGNPPLGGPPPGNPPPGGPPYIYRLGAGIPPCGLIHPNGTCVVLSVLPTLGGSADLGPMALNRAASSSFYVARNWIDGSSWYSECITHWFIDVEGLS
jgi:hypothetical protein